MTIGIDLLLAQFGARIVSQLQNDILTKDITKYGPANASGALAKSIRFDVSDGTLTIYGLDYIYYLENGRKPGTFPNVQSILDWIDAKGIMSQLTDKKISKDSLAYLIGRKIATKGTTVYQQGGSDLVSAIINTGLIQELKDAIGEFSVEEILDGLAHITGSSNVIKLAA